MRISLRAIASFTSIALLLSFAPHPAVSVEGSSPAPEPLDSISQIARFGEAIVSMPARFGADGVPLSVLRALPSAAAGFARPLDLSPVVPRRTVLVIGGTPAGVAAALAAARRGLDVTLVSGRADLGGVLTEAMMDQWDLNRDVLGRSLEGGIFAEMYARLGDGFSPGNAARQLDAMVASQRHILVIENAEPVTVLTTQTSGELRVAAVVVRDRATNARERLTAQTVVDATDDADIAADAGARYDLGRQDTGVDERMQSVTLMFSIAGVDWTRLRQTYVRARDGAGGVTDRHAWGYARLVRRYRPLDPDALVRDLNFGRSHDGLVTANAVDLCNVNALSPVERRRAVRVARRESFALLTFLRARLPGFEHARIAAFARDLYVRETRHVAGLARLTSDDVWQGHVPGDAIGLSSYPIDLHAVTPRDAPAFATARHIYGIPFGTLVPRGFANLALAGPAISATHLASASARVVPTTVEEGEAAGVAAALSAESGIDLAGIAASPHWIAALRRNLVAGGAILTVPPGAQAPAALPRAIASRRTWDVFSAPG